MNRILNIVFTVAIALGLVVFFGALLAPSAAKAQAPVLLYSSLDGGIKGQNMPVRIDTTGALAVSSSGGTVTSTPLVCASSSPMTYVSLGTSATTVIAAGTRYSVRICVTLEASGLPQVKCRTDGVVPAFGATPGDVLTAGDCVEYASAVAVSCIANASSTPVSVYACQ